MKRRTWKPIPLLLALLLVLSACAASGNSGASMDTAASVSESGGYGLYAAEPAEAEESDEIAGGSEADATADHYAQSQVKLIYTAYLELEVLDFDAARKDLSQRVEEMGGYCESSNLYNYGRSRSASYTVRVPSEQYRAFVDACSDWDNCHLLSCSEDVQNVGEAYFDAETRLATLRTKMERLQELLAQATEMEDIITIESAISETEYQIEQYTSTLNRYDSLIGYATVHISLDEVTDLTEEEEVSLLSRLGQNLRWGAERFLDSLEDLTLWLAYNIIDLLLLALAVGIVVLIVRKLWNRRKGKLLSTSAKPKPGADNSKPEPDEEKTGK